MLAEIDQRTDVRSKEILCVHLLLHAFTLLNIWAKKVKGREEVQVWNAICEGGPLTTNIWMVEN